MLSMPSTARLQSQFRDAHRLIEVVGEPVTIELRAPDDTYETFGPVKAKVSTFAMADILANAVLRQGDLKALLHGDAWTALGIPDLQQKDRVRWRGRAYSVLRFDTATHSLAGELFAVEMVLRG